jgi:hypothetical protein
MILTIVSNLGVGGLTMAQDKSSPILNCSYFRNSCWLSTGEQTIGFGFTVGGGLSCGMEQILAVWSRFDKLFSAVIYEQIFKSVKLILHIFDFSCGMEQILAVWSRFD